VFSAEDEPILKELREEAKETLRKNFMQQAKKTVCPECGEEMRDLRGSKYCPNLLRHSSSSSQDEKGIFLQI